MEIWLATGARPHEVLAMSAGLKSATASAIDTAPGGALAVALGGDWQVIEPRPAWTAVLANRRPQEVRPTVDEVDRWDSSLLLFLFEIATWCKSNGAEFNDAALPEKIRRLLGQFTTAHAGGGPVDRSDRFLTSVGRATLDTWGRARAASAFVGETVLSLVRLIRNPRGFRWRDCLDEMQQCGAMALPIVSLISFLVGLIMAYQAAVQLRQFGADIYVADLVGLSVVREMGPMMAAIILAGRTGAAFAATLANMKANEEIDALETLGISSVRFLVLPRLIALGIMMPLLTLYANGVGILGGMAVGAGVLDIPPTAYWIETQSIVDLSDVNTGLIKAVFFGMLIGLSGCLRGLQAERSAAGVGRAATSAVVTSILLIIVADAVFAVVFNILGW